MAACLSKDFSPQAPEVVLCGQGVRTGPVSELFSRHPGALPVFVKRESNRWQYRGQFIVTDSFIAGPRFASYIAGSGRSNASVSRVVLLRHVD